MTELGIALSTFYKWKGRWETFGTSWVANRPITRAIRLPGKTCKATEAEIVQLSLLNPSWGSQAIATYLERNFAIRCSASTVRNILGRRGLATRAERTEVLHQRYIAGKRLTKAQRMFIRDVAPFATWPSGRPKGPGRVLIQDQISISRTSPFGGSRLHIIVDALDGRAFAGLAESKSRRAAPELLSKVIAHYESVGQKVIEVVTDDGLSRGKYHRGSQLHMVLDQRGICYTNIDAPKGQRNRFVQQTWSDIRHLLLSQGAGSNFVNQPELTFARGRIKELLHWFQLPDQRLS